ncbi:hypothetical protein ACFQ77_06730 [Streptomyces virginiae]|uniref:hypothetical protein n=1 Tax=Streptomyces virginiae TaxID=1961 RepID=UPI003693A25C
MGISLHWPVLLVEHTELTGDPISVLRQARASEPDREAALRQLAEAADEGGPAVRNAYAAGLYLVGRLEEAAQVWQTILSEKSAPIAVGLNLALCHLENGRIEECRNVLDACRQRVDPASDLGRLVGRRCAEFDRAISDWERDVHLTELRAAALRERIALETAHPRDFKQLARALGALSFVENSGVTARDALDAARQARERAPEDPEALELLVAALLRAGTADEVGDALHELERMAPNSMALSLRREATTTEARAQSRARQDSMEELGVRARTGDRAAEDLLRRESQRFPNNFQYRVDLAFAAFSRGDRIETRRLTDELAGEPAADHFVHFHIAQLYWFLGEHELGREQFRRAYETAATERDREDVRFAVRTVGAGDPEELGLR